MIDPLFLSSSGQQEKRKQKKGANNSLPSLTVVEKVMKVGVVLATLGACCVGALGDWTGVNSDCDTYVFAPEFLGSLRNNVLGPCSGHGTCLTANLTQATGGICECDQGWTGRSDFVNLEGQDCGVYTLGLRIVWGIQSFATVLYGIIGIPRVLLRYKQHVEQRNLKRAAGKEYGLKNNRGLIACLWYYGLCWPSILAAGIVMQIDPLQRIGLDLPITIIFITGKIGFYGATWLFQPALLATILKGKSNTKQLAKLNDVGSALICAWASLLGFVPLATKFGTEQGRGDLATIVYYIVMLGTLFQLFALGLQAFYVKVKVAEVLDLSYSMTKAERTLAMKKALVEVQRENIIQTAVQGSVFGMFSLWVFMYGRHAYFFPITWIAFAIIGKKLAFTTIDTRSSGSRTGTSKGSSSSGADASKSFSESKDFSTSAQVSTFVNTKLDEKFKENVVSFHAAEDTFSDDEGMDDGYV